ncbi:Protein of unknown function [Tindallia magadiensis]|uniref:DUF3307 domain-containing protein n=1 Tax=Tindallia magadiensis TaxID=69895 RepID=A0A1I3I645_9FIRM|nr:DUF3307 domain-containing protein [Tindallia magadiensis]SFI43330.1 Protein of unknown function [Tindallia magadiensis]
MNSNLFIIYLIVHIVADFYLQSEKLAIKKKDNFWYLLLHCLYYAIISIMVIIPFWTKAIFFHTIGLIFSHLIIDIIKYFVSKRLKKSKIENKKLSWIFICDQIAHIVSIIIIVILYSNNNADIYEWMLLWNQGSISNDILRYALITVLIFKPTNICFREVFLHIKPENKEEEKEKNNIGQLIGNLERLLILILLSLNQFTAIGLVFTAKSITRYDKITKEKEFAEYYLLGTLYSVIATLLLYIFIIGVTEVKVS